VPSAHQGGGEPLRPIPLEVARCLRVPGVELAPPPPLVRCGPGRVVAVDSPWPNGQPGRSCGRRRLVPACARRRRRLGASSHPGLGASARLARLATPAAACQGGGGSPPPVTLAGLTLFPSAVELPGNGDRPRERLRLIAVDDLEATYCLLDRHRGEVQQRLERASDLLVLLGDAAKELLNSSLLVVGVVPVLHHLLQQSVEAESKVINVLIWLEGQILPLLAKCL
jgi:hypothetical protein